jgi:hypothetical protein
MSPNSLFQCGMKKQSNYRHRSLFELFSSVSERNTQQEGNKFDPLLFMDFLE